MVRKKTGTNGSAESPARPLTLKEFGHRLDGLLLDRRWSQADLARHARVSKDTVSKWVKGAVTPNPVILQKVADALRMSVEDLYPGFGSSDLVEFHRSEGVAFDLDSRTATLSFNGRRVSLDTGKKIMELIENDVADGS